MKPIYLFLLFISINVFSQSPVTYPGYPLLMDSIDIPTKFSAILTADLDKDGSKEIILSSSHYNLRVIKTNAQYQTGFPKYYDHIVRFISCGDVDGNGYMEIVVRTENMIYVYDKSGIILPGFPVYINSVGRKFASLYDLDNDGKLEIIADRDSGLVVYNYNGQIRNGWPVNSLGICWVSPALGDIDNDGYGEIILSSFINTGTPKGIHRIYRHNGISFSNNWPITDDSSYVCEFGPPSLYIKQSVIDTTFICIASNIFNFQNNHKSRITKYGVNGEILKRIYMNPVVQMGQVIIGKLDNQLYLGAGNILDEIYLLTKDLQVADGWSQIGCQANYSSSIFGKVMSGNEINTVSLLRQADPFYGYGIDYFYKVNGENLNWSPLRTYGLNSSHAFSDINNDGSIDYIYRASQHAKSYLKIFTFQGLPYTAENYPWPMYGHDRWSTNQYGFIPPDELIGIEPISHNMPKSFELYQNYPNPFNASTIIKFDIKKESHVRMVIYDILGRIVSVLFDQKLIPGNYRLSWNPVNLSSGVYFYEITSVIKDKIYFRESRKAVITK